MKDSLLVVIRSWFRVLFLGLGLAGALAAQRAPIDADWAAVRGLAKGNKVEVHLYDARPISGRVVQVAEESITISVKNGERAFTRGEVKRVKVPSVGRRVLHGAIGLFAGFGVASLACPSCANELREDIAYRNAAIGAGVGSLAFLIPGHRTIYKGPRRASPPKSTP